MRIEEFEYLDIAINELEKYYDELTIISDSIEDFISNTLQDSKLEFINVSSRVKSSESLREKIFRNKYYKKYPNPNDLLFNLSDLIGVRIECRFSDDEKNIYRYLKRYFNKKENNFYYYNDSNIKFYLKFQGKQPQKQKNGFTIYRIDGKYVHNNLVIPFELQIKSLVNMFWGEIEHQIIYKNSNYIIEDKFLKDIMGSIKNNLSMIDKQLLTVFNHFDSKKRTDNNTRKKHLEDIVSKMVYDVFSNKMKDSIGMVVNFKNSCETIIRYSFSLNEEWTDSEYTQVMINALNRISVISDKEIDFNLPINFERNAKYKDDFSKILGDYFQNVMNKEFNWNLFFRILFTLEPLNNVGDFEKFLSFLQKSFISSPQLEESRITLQQRFENNFNFFENEMLINTAQTLVDIDSIDIVYDYNIFDVSDILESSYEYVCDNVFSFDEWTNNKNEILGSLEDEIRAIFD